LNIIPLRRKLYEEHTSLEHYKLNEAFAIAGLIPTAVLLLGLFFIPESPRWLVSNKF
jgi:hypothetical protein